MYSETGALESRRVVVNDAACVQTAPPALALGMGSQSDVCAVHAGWSCLWLVWFGYIYGPSPVPPIYLSGSFGSVPPASE